MVRSFIVNLAVPTCLSIALWFCTLCLPVDVDAQSVRIKDICGFQDRQETELFGYGLIIGLDGTGDGSGTQFTVQSMANMMERLGVTVDQKKLKVKNVAAVIVTAKLSSHHSNGSLDLTTPVKQRDSMKLRL